MTRITWYEAAAYCDWLSRNEGLQECYEPNPAGEYADGMRIRKDALGRNGYRLPTEAEWEYACRAGAQTSRPFGFASELLPRYAWYQENSTDRAWPGGSLMPNDLGLFDMLGNVYEWCHDVYRDYPPWGRGRIVEDVDTSTSIDALAIRNLRGLTFHSFHAGVRSASRNNDEPSSRNLDHGFRPARTLPR